jgi:hypothetical protein
LNDENQREHLWIIATEPGSEGSFAIASFAWLRGAKDQTVILCAAEHPFLKWDTCISYGQAEIMSVEKLEAHLRCGRAKMHVDATHAVPATDPCGILGLRFHEESGSRLCKGRPLAVSNIVGWAPLLRGKKLDEELAAGYAADAELDRRIAAEFSCVDYGTFWKSKSASVWAETYKHLHSALAPRAGNTPY